MPYHVADYNTNMVLKMVDTFMHQFHGIVKCLVCDAHLSHNVVRRVFLGNITPEDEQILTNSNLQFLSKLQYKDLPPHNLPKLPVRLAMYDGESYHLLNAC